MIEINFIFKCYKLGQCVQYYKYVYNVTIRYSS